MYSYDNYMELIKYIYKKYNFQRTDIAKNIVEFGIEKDIPILRVLHHSGKKDIIISFHAQSSIYDSIIIFDQLRERYQNIKLVQVYYISDDDGDLVIGPDAEALMYRDFEKRIISELRAKNTPRKTKDKPKKLINSVVLDDFIKNSKPKRGENWN